MREIVDKLHESRQIELAKSILESHGYKVINNSLHLNEMANPTSRSLASRIFSEIGVSLPQEHNTENSAYVVKYYHRNLVIYAEEDIRLPAKDVTDTNHVNSIRFDSSANMHGEELLPDSLKILPVSKWSDNDIKKVAAIIQDSANTLGIDLFKSH